MKATRVPSSQVAIAKWSFLALGPQQTVAHNDIFKSVYFLAMGPAEWREAKLNCLSPGLYFYYFIAFPFPCVLRHISLLHVFIQKMEHCFPASKRFLWCKVLCKL